MDGIFNSEIFNNSIFNVGEVVIGFGPGIGLAIEEPHKPVDFVYSIAPSINVPQFRVTAKIAQQLGPKNENADMREMMELYSWWKMAA